jgi:hypothetical protein
MGERDKFKTYLSGDRGNYGRKKDVSLSRGREGTINLKIKIKTTDW